MDLSQLADAGAAAGNFPTYNFTTEQARISITKAGGLAASLLHSRKVEEASLTVDQAKEKALAFLQKNGIQNLAESYYVVYDNICTIQYAFAQDDITFYPDLIKVSVALDNGEIMEYNGSGYLMNHHDRKQPSPALTEQQAASKVSERLSIQKAGLAVISQPPAWKKCCATNFSVLVPMGRKSWFISTPPPVWKNRSLLLSMMTAAPWWSKNLLARPRPFPASNLNEIQKAHRGYSSVRFFLWIHLVFMRVTKTAF